MAQLPTSNSLNMECTYMTEGAVMPFCKGCGHSHILKKLNTALEKLKLNPNNICLVTDIGCIGLADSLYDKVHTVHTTHGRSTAFATGIALADKVLADKKLKTIVLIGDGGATIGLLHIVNAALLNSDVTVIVANNFLFGMTGGQQSFFSPLEFITQTSPFGNVIPPLDICKVAVSSKCEFVARKVSTQSDLSDTIADAIVFDGFALVEVLDLCTEWAVEKNNMTGASLFDIALKQGNELGYLINERNREEFGEAYKTRIVTNAAKHNLFTNFIKRESKHNLARQVSVVLAGSAGEKVQSSAALLCEAAVRAGLYTSQKNDNPVTQGSGFSLSEIILSPAKINFTGIEKPTAVIVISNEGLNELVSQNVFERIDLDTQLIFDDSINYNISSFQINLLPFRKICTPKKAALGALDYFIASTRIFPLEILHTVYKEKYGDYNKLYKADLLKEFLD